MARQLDTSTTRLLEADFTDVEALCAEVRSWDLDFQPLSTTSKHNNHNSVGHVIQSRCGPLELAYARFSASIEQSGAPPAGLWTFVVPEAGLRRLWWRGHDVDAGNLLIFPFGSELRSVSGPDFEVHTISVSEAAIAERCERLELRPSRTRPPPEVLRPTLKMLDGLRQSLCQIRDQNSGFVEPGPNTIIDQLVSAWLGPGHRREAPRSSPRARDRAINRCLEFIEDSEWSELSVSGLYEVARVSERTLQQGFRERFALTPAAFLKARRLAAVRRHLLEADQGVATVGAVSAAVGFWHVGQFAADYRRSFGETPSATLKRHRG